MSAKDLRLVASQVRPGVVFVCEQQYEPTEWITESGSVVTITRNESLRIVGSLDVKTGETT